MYMVHLKPDLNIYFYLKVYILLYLLLYKAPSLKHGLLKVLHLLQIAYIIYGRKVPKNAHGTINLKQYTSSTKLITEASLKLFEKIINKGLLIRKVNITANHVMKNYQKRTRRKISFRKRKKSTKCIIVN